MQYKTHPLQHNNVCSSYTQMKAVRQSLRLTVSLFAVKVKKGKRSIPLISNTGLWLAAMGPSINPMNPSVK